MRLRRAFPAPRAFRGALALCAAALLALPGCGSSGNTGKPIPTSASTRMIALLQLADQQATDGKCGGATAKVREAEGVLAQQVPKSVDPDVRRNLATGLERLRTLIADQCQRPQQTDTTTTPTETTPTETTQTQTTQTDTTPTDTNTTPTETTTTPTTTTPTTTTPTDTTPTTTTGTGGTPPPPANGATGETGQ